MKVAVLAVYLASSASAFDVSDFSGKAEQVEVSLGNEDLVKPESGVKPIVAVKPWVPVAKPAVNKFLSPNVTQYREGCADDSSQDAWSCCINVTLSKSLAGLACVNMTFVPDLLMVDAVLSWDRWPVLNESFHLATPYVCAPLPVVSFVTACAGLDNVTINFSNKTVSACAYISFSVFGWTIAKEELYCRDVSFSDGVLGSEAAAAIVTSADGPRAREHSQVSLLASLLWKGFWWLMNLK